MPLNFLDYLLPANQPWAILINTVIGTITVVALFFIVREAWQLGKEAGHLHAVTRRVKSSFGSDKSTNEMEESPADPEKREKRFRDQLKKEVGEFPNRSTVRQRVEDLHHLHSEGHDLEMESLVAQTAGQLDDQLGLARWASGAVLLLGLGGTVLGLAISTSAATELIQDATATTLPTAIRRTIETFRGLGLAFSTTLVGVLASMILSALVAWRRHSQSSFLRDFEHLTAVYLAPHFTTSVSQSLATAAKNLTAIEAELRGTLESVVKDLQESLTDVTDQIRTRGQSLTSTIDQSFGDLLSGLKDTSSEILSKHDESLRSLHQSLGNARDELREQSAEILSKHDESLKSLHHIVGSYTDGPPLSDLIAHVQEGITAIQDSAKEMRSILPEIGEHISQNIDRQTSDMHQTLTDYTTRIAQSVDEQKEIVTDGLARYTDAIPLIRSGVIESIQAQGQAFKNLLEQYQSRLEELEVGHAQSVREQTQGMNDQLAAVGSQIQRLDDAIRDLHKAAVVLDEAGRQDTARRQSAEGPFQPPQPLQDGRPPEGTERPAWGHSPEPSSATVPETTIGSTEGLPTTPARDKPEGRKSLFSRWFSRG